MRKHSKLLAGSIGFLLAILLLAAGEAAAREILEVRILNWPEITAVQGRVSVEGPIRQSEVATFSGVVTTIVPEDTTRLVSAGVLDADGYSTVMLSLESETRGDRLSRGISGAILVPEGSRAKRAMLEEKVFFFPMEVRASVTADDQVFATGEQIEFRLAFPRYEVFFYNTSKSAVDLTLTAHLAN